LKPYDHSKLKDMDESSNDDPSSSNNDSGMQNKGLSRTKGSLRLDLINADDNNDQIEPDK
jgi:hypothetical protein